MIQPIALPALMPPTTRLFARVPLHAERVA